MELELSGVRLFAFTTKGLQPYHEVQYRKGDTFLFGPESRGLHYNLDYPQADPAWAQRDSVVRKAGESRPPS